MRIVSHLLFLVFYVASSYAITQERTSLVIQELGHSLKASGDAQFDSACKQLRNGYPNFSEAKKVGSDFPLHAVHALDSVLEMAQVEYHPQPRSCGSLLLVWNTPARAPPVLE